ncbi:MAG: NAD-dependent epimerase/dehydratase family protein [Bryobacteraceae bacterium]
MNTVLVTGATGYIGTPICELLLERGYTVHGLARSTEAVEKLTAAGISPVRASLTDTAALAGAARQADAVIHTALNWGQDAGATDRAAVAAMLDALGGSKKPFLYTSGVWVMGSTGGRLAGEMFPLNPPPFLAWRPQVERMVLDATERGVRGVVIRPATCYGREGGIVAKVASGARPLIGDGENHWSFVHVEDLAELYVLALEKAAPGALYVAAHGAAVKVKSLGAALAIDGFVPLESARATFGPLADALALDQKIGSTRAGRELGWIPSRPHVLEEIRRARQ